MKTKKCIACGWPQLTWGEARHSYALMVRKGIPPEEAKVLSPRCGRCTATVTRKSTNTHGAMTPAPVDEVRKVSDF